jgi:O-antigen/teichoic acid export membrane protein
MNIVGQSAWPEFTILYGRGDLPGLRRLLYSCNAMNVGLACVASIAYVLIGPQLITLWTHHQIQAPRLLILAFALSVVTNAGWFSASTLLLAGNQHRRFYRWYFVGSLVTTCVMGVTLHFFGLIPACYTLLLSDFIVGPVILIQALDMVSATFRDLGVGMLQAVGHFPAFLRRRRLA